MTIKIGFPDIPKRTVKFTSTDTWGDTIKRNDLINNISGPRYSLASLQSNKTGLVRVDYDLGETTSTVDHCVIGNADLLKADDVKSVRLRGSRQSAFVPSSISGLKLWLDATRGVTTVSGAVSQWDDLSGSGNNATQGTAANRPYLSRYDTNENLVLYSNSITTGWAATFATINDATKVTITATNGRLDQSVPVINGVQYVLSARIRAVSGNTNINFRHVGATSSLTAITVTGTLASYSATVTANSASINFGIQDTNASGFGQIEITDISLRRSTTTSTHVQTTDSPQYAGINSNRALFFDGTTDFLSVNSIASLFTGSDIQFTFICFAKHSTTATSQAYFTFGNSTGSTNIHELYGATSYRSFRRDSGATSVSSTGGSIGTSNIVISFVFSGTTIDIYVNGSAVVSGSAHNVGSLSLDRATIGAWQYTTVSEFFNGYIGEVLVYNSALGSTDRENLEQYLTDKWTLAPTIATHTLSTDTLANNDLAIIPSATSSAYRHWWLEMESDAASKFTHSKIYFGLWLDMGEVIEDLRVLKGSDYSSLTKLDSGAAKLSRGVAPKYLIEITWTGLTDAIVKTFIDSVGSQINISNSFYLYSGSNTDQLNGESLLYCKLIEWGYPEKNKLNYNTITAVFEELT